VLDQRVSYRETLSSRMHSQHPDQKCRRSYNKFKSFYSIST